MKIDMLSAHIFVLTFGKFIFSTLQRFYEGGSVRYWACVNFSDLSLDDVKNSCGKLISTCNRRGMVCRFLLSYPIDAYVYLDSILASDMYHHALQECCSKTITGC